MSQLTIGRHSAHAYQPIRVIFAALQRLRENVVAWRKQQRARAQLLLLDERGLQDIGISRSQAAFEAEKPFWRM